MEYGALMDTITPLPCVNYSVAQRALISASAPPHEPPVAPLTIAGSTRPPAGADTPLIVGTIAIYTGATSADAPTDPVATLTPSFFFGGDGSIGYNPGTGWADPTLGDVSDWPHWG